jgi:hypothetical protein
LTLETLTLETGERGEFVLYPDQDVLSPSLVVEGPTNFVVEEVLLDNLPVPSVEVSDTQRGTWTAKIRDVSAGPERPLKVVVVNTSAGRVTLRASIPEEIT